MRAHDSLNDRQTLVSRLIHSLEKEKRRTQLDMESLVKPNIRRDGRSVGEAGRETTKNRHWPKAKPHTSDLNHGKAS